MRLWVPYLSDVGGSVASHSIFSVLQCQRLAVARRNHGHTAQAGRSSGKIAKQRRLDRKQ